MGSPENLPILFENQPFPCSHSNDGMRQMKTTRSLVAALVLALAAAACSSSPTAPNPGSTDYNFSPLLGSGVGG